jgi:hypothetical protein
MTSDFKQTTGETPSKGSYFYDPEGGDNGKLYIKSDSGWYLVLD